MRLTWVLLSALMVILSGCASENDGSEAPAAAGQEDPAGGQNGTAEGIDDAADDATSEASSDAPPLDVVFAATNLTGTAPLSVDFTINGTAPNATWHIDFGDNTTADGTGLPATVNHTFQEGNHTVRLDVQDDGRNATQTLQVEVAAGAPASFEPLTIAESGTFVTGTQGASGCGVQGEIDKDTYEWIIPAEVDGVPIKATAFTMHMDLGTTNVDSDIYLQNPDGAVIGSSSDFNAPFPVIGSGEPTEDFTIEGDYAPGTYTVVIRACAGANMEYEFTGEANIVAA